MEAKEILRGKMDNGEEGLLLATKMKGQFRLRENSVDRWLEERMTENQETIEKYDEE
jgi:hypothetical protein